MPTLEESLSALGDAVNEVTPIERLKSELDQFAKILSATLEIPVIVFRDSSGLYLNAKYSNHILRGSFEAILTFMGKDGKWVATRTLGGQTLTIEVHEGLVATQLAEFLNQPVFVELFREMKKKNQTTVHR